MRVRFLLSVLPLVLFAAGCGGDSSTSPSANVSGTYSLKSVNGTAVPTTIVDQGITTKINSGTLTVNSGGTYSNTINFTQTVSGQQTTTNLTCNGSYTQNGNSLSFTESNTADCGGTYNGSFANGNTLTLAYDATTQAVYQK